MATDPEPAMSTVWDEWETFRNLGHFVNHWDRPGWTEHTQTYHWFLTFETAGNLQRLAEQCQSHLDDISTLDPVPPALVHLTIERVGYADDVTPDQVTSIADAARQRCSKFSPFSLRIGPLAGSAGAVRFSVTPHDPIKQLRDLLMDAQAQVLGDDGDEESAAEPSPYVPHLSIAYSNAETPSTPIVERVERLRALGSIVVPIQYVELVRLQRENRVYVWDRVATLDFEG